MKRVDFKLKQTITNREDSLEWHKSSYEIVKYLPEYYNENGCYQKEEWTSMWDIGRYIGGELVTKEDYLAIENQYVNTALDIMEKGGCKLMTVVFWGGRIKPVIPSLIKESPLGDADVSLYRSSFGLRSGCRVSLDKAALLLRLSLREWNCFYLVNLLHDTQIDVGYDYYMHVHSGLPIQRITEIVESHRLYLNPRQRAHKSE